LKKNYRLWRTSEAVLKSGPSSGFVSVPLDQVGDRILRTFAVKDLLSRVVRVRDVGPRDVLKVFAAL
jgi:hypothetical protein